MNRDDAPLIAYIIVAGLLLLGMLGLGYLSDQNERAVEIACIESGRSYIDDVCQ